MTATLPAGLYSSARYGSEEVPAGDLVMNIYVALLLGIPLGPRGYRLFQMGTARIKVIGTLAHRIVYGGPGRP